MTDEDYMNEAIKEAEKAFLAGEVPVGAVVVWDGKIVGRGHNLRETEKNAIKHAEICAIDEACRNLGGWRLWKGTIYVTLEPCPMCAGAIINSRMEKVIFGANDSKNGAMGSILDLTALPFGYKPKVYKGIMKDECENLIKRFFENIRKNVKEKNYFDINNENED